jgi:hypothetical protein
MKTNSFSNNNFLFLLSTHNAKAEIFLLGVKWKGAVEKVVQVLRYKYENIKDFSLILPPEIVVFEIFQHLGYKDLESLFFTSQRFQRLMSKEFWFRKCVEAQVVTKSSSLIPHFDYKKLYLTSQKSFENLRNIKFIYIQLNLISRDVFSIKAHDNFICTVEKGGKYIRVYKAVGKSCCFSYLMGFKDRENCVVVVHDFFYPFIVYGTLSGVVKVFKIVEGARAVLLFRYECCSRIQALKINNLFLVCVSLDCSINLWNISSFTQLLSSSSKGGESKLILESKITLLGNNVSIILRDTSFNVFFSTFQNGLLVNQRCLSLGERNLYIFSSSLPLFSSGYIFIYDRIGLFSFFQLDFFEDEKIRREGRLLFHRNISGRVRYSIHLLFLIACDLDCVWFFKIGDIIKGGDVSFTKYITKDDFLSNNKDYLLHKIVEGYHTMGHGPITWPSEYGLLEDKSPFNLRLMPKITESEKCCLLDFSIGKNPS